MNSFLRLFFSGCMSALCLVAIGNNPVHAQQPTPLSEVRQLPLNSLVPKVAVRVTVSNQFRNTCFVQDGSAGIAVFNTAFRGGVKVGDSVIIENGTVTEFQATTNQPGTGLLQLTAVQGANFSFTVVPAERKEPTPRNIAVPSIGESSEGQLVRVRGVEFVQTGTFQGETNYTLRNQAGLELQLRIDGGTEIATNFLPIPVGRVDIVGVLSQFRGAYQVQPRFSLDLGLPPIEIDSLAKEKTLDMTTWNLYWFGHGSNGPADKQRQFESVVRAMNTMNNDVYAVQEIANPEFFERLKDTLNGNFGGILAKSINQDQKMGWIFRNSAVALLDSGLAVNGGAQAWASGRFPYRFTFRSIIEGKSFDMYGFVIHGKATDSLTALQDRQRRQTDAETFHAYLNEFYRDKNVVVMGDFNDDVIQSTILDGSHPSPYAVFVNDPNNWTVLTKPLSELGLASYIRSNRSMIDHIVVSNEVAPHIHRTFIETPNAYLSSYTSTVSDHLPITTRITPMAATSVNDPISAMQQIRVSPNPATTTAMVEITLPTNGFCNASLTDALGQEAAPILKGYFEAGVEFRSIPVDTLSAGIYFVSVKTEGLRRTVPVAVIK